MADPISAAATAFAAWATSSTTAAVGASLAAGTASFATVAAYAVAYAGISTAVTMGLSAISRASLPDVEGQKVTRKQPRPIRVHAIGGPSRMSGSYMLRESSGNKLGVVIAICEGRLASIDAVYLNDDLVTLSSGFVQGQANERYGTGDLIRLETRLGAPTETHYGFLTANFGTYWPTSARGDGIASLGFLAQHRSRESFARHFPNGEPIPSIVGTPVCYDWRDVAQDREDPATWQACENPVVWLVHVEWHRHGRNWDRCIAPVLSDLTFEADYCDDVITVDGVTEARYRCAGNYPVNTEPQAVREGLLSTMDGWLSVNGKGHIVIKAGRYDDPSFTLTGEHIDGYSWRAFTTDEEAINELIVSYVSAAHDYSEIEAGTYSDEADITATGKVRSEPLSLPWVPSATQAMRLARRKMLRVNAQRRGQVRCGIYGLNGLGQRFIRVQNPELNSMADVVVEVTNVEVDFATATVTFDILLADEEIDDEDALVVEVPPVVTFPSVSPGLQEPAVTVIGRDVDFPVVSADTLIDVASYAAILPDGSTKTLPAGSITGLTPSTFYSVFHRDDLGYEAEVYPGLTRKASGSYLFLGNISTDNGAGVHPTPDPPPGGWGGEGAAQLPE